jgi:hypothetical protein
MSRPKPPVKKPHRPAERDKSYVDSATQMERDLAAALEATRSRLAEQKAALEKMQIARRWR